MGFCQDTLCFQEGHASLSFSVIKMITLGDPRCGSSEKKKKKKENVFDYAVIFAVDPLGLSVDLILFSNLNLSGWYVRRTQNVESGPW